MVDRKKTRFDDEDDDEDDDEHSDVSTKQGGHSLPQLQYSIEDIPPWYLWILLGFQVMLCWCSMTCIVLDCWYSMTCLVIKY